MPPATGAPDYPPPDGGWGWVVVFGAFISIGFSYAFPKAITVFFKEIQEIFHTSYSEIAWISSIMLAVMYAGGKTLVKLVNSIAWLFGFFYGLKAFFSLRALVSFLYLRFRKFKLKNILQSFPQFTIFESIISQQINAQIIYSGSGGKFGWFPLPW